MGRLSQAPKQLRLEIRFGSLDERALAEDAAKHAGHKSLNAWVIPALIAAARRELAPVPPELSQCD
jgi:uncharacterized protein (DUF1778 family)